MSDDGADARRVKWLAALAPQFANPEVDRVEFYTASGTLTATVTRDEWLDARRVAPVEPRLAFAEFSAANRARCEAPTGFNHTLESWSISDWFVAIVGELGEAANIVKKLNRIRDGIRGNTQSEPELRAKLRSEVADAFIYLDLIAQACGFDLGEAVVDTFNAKSAEIGYQKQLGEAQRIAAPPEGTLEELPGLNLDMLDADRLRTWAERFDEFGPDITEWGSRLFVITELRRIALAIEAEVRAVGTLRERVRAAAGVHPPQEPMNDYERSDAAQCGERDRPGPGVHLECTRPRGHHGNHRAHGGPDSYVIGEWASSIHPPQERK